MTYSSTPALLDQHRDEIVRLWKENLGEQRIRDVASERLQWLYQDHPTAPPTTVLATASEAGVIGCGTICARELTLDGRTVKGGMLSDFAVDKRHRVAGPALTMQRALAAAGYRAGLSVVYGWPNAKSVALLKRIGYSPIGTATHWVKPLRSENRLRHYLKHKVAARVAAPLVDTGLLSLDAARAALSLIQYDTEIVSSADARFDELWQRTRDRFPFITGEKSSAYLNWRYSSFTTSSYKFFCLLQRSTRRLLGYIVFDLRYEAACVADMYCEDLETHAIPLIKRLALHCRREPVRSIMLTFVGTDRLAPLLSSAGFFRRDSDRYLVVGTDAGVSEADKARLLDVQSWYMCDGDLDI